MQRCWAERFLRAPQKALDSLGKLFVSVGRGNSAQFDSAQATGGRALLTATMSQLALIQKRAKKAAAIENAHKVLTYRGQEYRVGFVNGKPVEHGQATYRGVRYVF